MDMVLWYGITLLSALISGVQGSLDYECGGYVEADKSSETGTLSTPNYPSNYPDQVKCIWLIRAPTNFAVQVTIDDGPHGQLQGGTCMDYMEIRNGSSSSTLLFSGCEDASGQQFTSSSRWIWIMFYSDYQTTNSGVSISWSIVDAGDDATTTSPVSACQGVNFRCANQECVYQAYKCDGWNDCGCSGGGCDEDDCGGLSSWGTATRIGVGVGVGSSVFVIIFFGIGILEILLKRRAEQKEKKYLEDTKRRAKQKRAAAKAKETETLAIPGAGGELNSSFNSSKSASSSVSAAKNEKAVTKL